MLNGKPVESWFYPRPPGGGRRDVMEIVGKHLLYPRPPGGGRHTRAYRAIRAVRFLSTPSGWRATAIPSKTAYWHKVSIHALRVEGDATPGAACAIPCRFLSTPSGWRATSEQGCCTASTAVSIHALRVEGDAADEPGGRAGRGFYPRPPGGGRQDHVAELNALDGFYPRPPGGGRPVTSPYVRKRCPKFYPRPPGGGRQQKRTKFSSVFAQKGEEFASLRRGKRKICRWRFKKDKFGVLICAKEAGKACALWLRTAGNQMSRTESCA